MSRPSPVNPGDDDREGEQQRLGTYCRQRSRERAGAVHDHRGRGGVAGECLGDDGSSHQLAQWGAVRRAVERVLATSERPSPRGQSAREVLLRSMGRWRCREPRGRLAVACESWYGSMASTTRLSGASSPSPGTNTFGARWKTLLAGRLRLTAQASVSGRASGRQLRRAVCRRRPPRRRPPRRRARRRPVSRCSGCSS